jgi:hypothetical protein
VPTGLRQGMEKPQEVRAHLEAEPQVCCGPVG